MLVFDEGELKTYGRCNRCDSDSHQLIDFNGTFLCPGCIDSDNNDETNPDYYKDLIPEPIDVILNWELGPCEANVVKYIARYKNKNGIEDLKKAKWYIEKLIERCEK